MRGCVLAFPQPDTFAFKPTTNPPDTGEGLGAAAVVVVALVVAVVVSVVVGTTGLVDAGLVVTPAAGAGDDAAGATAETVGAETTGEDFRAGRGL